MNTLSHLPPLPLVINYSDRSITQKDEGNMYLGLQQHDRVRRVVLQASSSKLRMWLEPMNNLFPILGEFFLLSTTTDSEEMSQVLPELLQAPKLHSLSLHGISLPKRLPLLSSMAALSKLCLTDIRESSYFPPGHLVAQLQGLPHLEALSIGFAIPIPLPSSEGKLLPAPLPPVTLPTLRWLTFRGVGVYLDNLVAQINTPVLERLNPTLHFELAFTLANLTEFICRTEGFKCLVARVVFNKDGASIEAGFNKQRALRKLSLRVSCEPLDWQIDSSAQVCSALGRALSAVEELTLDLDVDGMPSDWEKSLDSTLWHELLLPFIGVKKLHISSSLTLQLSQSLESVAGGLVLELLPELKELEVHLETLLPPLGTLLPNDGFSLFVQTRKSISRPVHLSIPFLRQPFQLNKLPFLPEDWFKSNFMQFTEYKGTRLNERDLVIDGQPINLWVLQKAVFSRNGFDSVSAHDEWPVIGVALGFPSIAGGDAGQPPRCGPIIAYRLQQLYNDVLRHFDQVYVSSIVARLRSSQASGQFQPQAQPHQPTEADYQALLSSITSGSSVMNSEAMSLLPRFSYTSGADLEAHHVPQHVVIFVEQNREHLQRAAQGQNGFRTGPPSTYNAPLDNRTQLNHATALRTMARPKQFIPGHQLPQLQCQGPVQGPRNLNTLPPGQLFNSVGPLVPPSTAQSMNASSIPSMSAQMAGSNPRGGLQNQGGNVSVSMNWAAMNGTSGSNKSMQIRRLTQEDLLAAKRLVNEKKRVAFSCAPDFNGVADYPPIPESDKQEYYRNMERLDQVLSNIEKYIHVAFAAMKKEDVVERMFTMMASVKSQLEELKKPNPLIVFELHTIRVKIQEADKMDKGLKAIIRTHLMPPGGVPLIPQPAPQPPSAITDTLFSNFSPPVPPTGPQAPAAMSRPPPSQPAHRKKPFQSLATPIPPPIPTATPQAATPGITALSPQTPKSPKGKPKPPTRRKGSKRANDVETPTAAHTVAPTPSSSKPVDAKGGGKRIRGVDDDTDAPRLRVSSAPSPKRVKTK